MKKLFKRTLALAALAVTLLSMSCAGAEGLNLNGGCYVWNEDPGYQMSYSAQVHPYSYLLGMSCYVKVNSGNMRADASVFSAKIGIVLNGERYVILGVKQDYKGDLWYLINNEGLYGFISSGIVTIR